MTTEQTYTAALDLIYGAILDDSLWPQAVAASQRAVGGCGALLGIDVAGRPRLLETTGYDAEALRSFETTYADKSFVWSLLPNAVEGEPIHDRQVLPPEQRRWDVFANEWARAYDTTDCVVRPLVKRGGASAFCVFARSPSCGEFDEEGLSREARLAPHLRRAVQLKLKADAHLQAAGLHLDAVERLGQGVGFVDADLNLTYLNPAALAVLDDRGSGLAVRAGRLACARSDDAALLRRLVSQATQGRDGPSQAGAMRVRSPERRDRLMLFCLPIREERRWLAEPRSEAMLLFSEPWKDRARPPLGAIGDLFGLTPAESRLALKLAGGDSLTEAAGHLGLTRNTVATQLKSVFHKTQTCRQADLVSLIQVLPKAAEARPRVN